MARSHFCIVSLLLLAISLLACCTPPPIGKNTLTVGELTISYPDGLEPQARELATIAEQVLPAPRTRLLQASQYMANQKMLAQQIAHKLGQPKAEKKIQQSLKLWPPKLYDQLLFSTLNHWRLYRVADVRVSGTFTDGAITQIVDPVSGEMTMRMKVHFLDGKSTDSLDGFIPFLVNDDGSIRYDHVKKSLADDIVSMIDGWSTMRFGVIHEVVEGYIVQDCKLCHPYTRWFNDGVANWVMYQLALAEMPESKASLDELCLPGKDEAERGKVNLLAWRQVTYSWSTPSKEEQQIDRASYRFSTELIHSYFAEQPEDALGKVLKALEKYPHANTDDICRALKTVTGKDAKILLFNYVPLQVKEDINNNKVQGYFDIGKYLLVTNSQQSVDNLLRTIQANPLNPTAHLFLALALRKLGNRNNDVDKAIILACTLGLTEDDYLQFAGRNDPDVGYICTRLRQLAGKK